VRGIISPMITVYSGWNSSDCVCWRP